MTCSPRIYLAVFLTVTIAVPLASNTVIPRQHRTYIPMLAGEDFVRDEFVRRNALAEDASPCLAFFGDSRAAFNIAGSIVDRYLPLGCHSQNYGFASLSLRKIRGLMNELPPSTIAVVSVSETMLDPPSSRGELRERLHELTVVRYFYLGYHRFSHMIQTVLKRKPPATGWDWQREQRRWLFSVLENRSFVTVPSYDREAEDLARNYFSLRSPHDVGDISEFLTWTSNRFSRLIVILPPSERLFQDKASAYTSKRRTGN